jgi:sigma-54 dependent transcriptional regulator, acetoin dehydrogenase operon transcriptional activator AcoR
MPHVSRISADRERFFEDAFASARVRQEIAASWKRSASSGVPTDRVPDVQVGEIGDRARRLLRAANPVLDRLANELCGTVTSIIISDAHARILARRDGDRGLRSLLDKVLAVPGACYGEDVVGTNGLGTAAERRCPMVVSGSEHYHEMFAPFTCVGAPLIHPLTRRFEGVLDLTCRYEDTNRLMLPMVLEAAYEITRRLYDATSRVERLLLERFLAEARRSNGPAIALSQDIIITNPAAGRLLGPADHALLWEWAARALRSGTSAEDVVLDSGVVAHVRVCPVGEGSKVLGSLIEVDLPRVRAARRRPRSGVPGLAGCTPEWHAVCAGVQETRSRRGPSPAARPPRRTTRDRRRAPSGGGGPGVVGSGPPNGSGARHPCRQARRPYAGGGGLRARSPSRAKSRRVPTDGDCR